jgi:hypothetical protein
MQLAGLYARPAGIATIAPDENTPAALAIPLPLVAVTAT